jgi:hypothetical protein
MPDQDPIKVKSKLDPKFIAYSDSLMLYNKGQKDLDFLIKNMEKYGLSTDALSLANYETDTPGTGKDRSSIDPTDIIKIEHQGKGSSYPTTDLIPGDVTTGSKSKYVKLLMDDGSLKNFYDTKSSHKDVLKLLKNNIKYYEKPKVEVIVDDTPTMSKMKSLSATKNKVLDKSLSTIENPAMVNDNRKAQTMYAKDQKGTKGQYPIGERVYNKKRKSWEERPWSQEDQNVSMQLLRKNYIPKASF